MIIREISKENIIEIILLPLLFGLIFGFGLFLFISLGLRDYVAYTGWCLLSGVIIILIIFAYTYRTISSQPKLALNDPRLYEYYRNIYQNQKIIYQQDPYGKPINGYEPRANIENKIVKRANMQKTLKNQPKKNT